jgi:hypothetical protein
MLRDPPARHAPRGRFPRPNLTLRELIGLVVAFAVSNAFLTWLNPEAASNVVLFACWNGMLALYLGFAFLQAWIRSIGRWLRAGDAAPPGRNPPRWTALGVAEATVIGGTVFGCSAMMLEKSRNAGLNGNDWAVLATILLISGASAFAVRALWRRNPHHGDVRRLAEPTPVEPLL